MWKSGDMMPESAVRNICRTLKIWLVVKILPFTSCVVLFIIVKITGLIVPTSIAVLCALYTAFLLWRNLKRLDRIKRREFAWCERVSTGMLGKYNKGDMLVDVGFQTIKGYGQPAGMFYLCTGRPVYVVMLNILESSFFRGGFVADPLVYKIKDK